MTRCTWLVPIAIVASLLLAGCQSGQGAESPEALVATEASAPVRRELTATAVRASTATATLTSEAEPETTATAAPEPVTATATERVPTAVAPSTPTTVEATATVVAEPTEPRGPVIVLDPGHDHTTPGALGIEYRVVLHAAFIAKEALEAAGYEVYLTRTDNEMSFLDDPALLPPNAADMHPGYGRAYAHASTALQYEPDMVIVLHFNGHPNPSVGGIEVYYCEMGGPQNLELAHIMRDELRVALQSVGYEPPAIRVAEDLGVARGERHFPSLGNVYTSDNEWVENRYAGIPVVLTEPLYMTNATELALIEDDATHVAIAAAYVRVADAWFGR